MRLHRSHQASSSVFITAESQVEHLAIRNRTHRPHPQPTSAQEEQARTRLSLSPLTSMACFRCAASIEGWITWRRGHGDRSVWIAYCTECTAADPEVDEYRFGADTVWTKRVRCCRCGWASQSCRCKARGPEFCLHAHGWCIRGLWWYCPMCCAALEFSPPSRRYIAEWMTCGCKHLVDDSAQ